MKGEKENEKPPSILNSSPSMEPRGKNGKRYNRRQKVVEGGGARAFILLGDKRTKGENRG